MKEKKVKTNEQNDDFVLAKPTTKAKTVKKTEDVNKATTAKVVEEKSSVKIVEEKNSTKAIDKKSAAKTPAKSAVKTSAKPTATVPAGPENIIEQKVKPALATKVEGRPMANVPAGPENIIEQKVKPTLATKVEERPMANVPADPENIIEQKVESKPAATPLFNRPNTAEKKENELTIKLPIVVKNFAEALNIKPNQLIMELMKHKIMANINQTIDETIAEKIALNYNKILVIDKRDKAKASRRAEIEVPEEIRFIGNSKDVTGRPPVVAFMGHVDHGKTSLQDALRKTNVAGGEHGGITQHIGSSVLNHNGNIVVMLDTPGHAAFSAMRARGANVTDIAILVVAANDGVMPQTIEAIKHARAANVPIIVALNKMDLENINLDYVFSQLQQHGILVEDWGGDIGCIKVSALSGMGLDDLMDRILLETEMLELQANLKIPGRAVVVESRMEAGTGVHTNILVHDGTIKIGDAVICGSSFGRVKSLIDEHGKKMHSVGASYPAQLIGLPDVPEVGMALVVCKDEKQARKIAQQRGEESRITRLNNKRPGTSLDDLFNRVSEQKKAELKVIVKADVKGSLEAINSALEEFPSDRVRLSVVDSAIGSITENDIILAESAGAFVIGFHVRVNPGVNRRAESAGVDIRLYSVIYELLDDVRNALEGKLETEKREQHLGESEIAQVFEIGKNKKICGCRVKEGAMQVSAKARVFRGKELIYNGSIASLRHYQDDVKEMKAGFECGIRLDNFTDFEVGDVIKAYKIIEKKATL